MPIPIPDKDANPSLKYGVHPKPQFPNRVDLYVPAGKKDMILEIQKALERDGSSLSSFVLELLEKWWKNHKPGNPQTPLERFDIKNQKPPSEWTLRMLQEKRRGEERWAKLNALTNEELLSRHSKLSGRDGYYMELCEISMILMHRRMSNQGDPL